MTTQRPGLTPSRLAATWNTCGSGLPRCVSSIDTKASKKRSVPVRRRIRSRFARGALEPTKPGHAGPGALPDESAGMISLQSRPDPAKRWTDARGRPMFPLDFPDVMVDPGVFVPTQGSFMVWKYLYQEAVGAHQRCLDIGCGSGLLTVQLARNDAAHVHAIDISPDAVNNTLTNAFREGVADRVTAAVQDLYPWVPRSVTT